MLKTKNKKWFVPRLSKIGAKRLSRKKTLKGAGFTLIELLVIIVIIIIIAVAVLAILDPLERRSQAQDAQRWSEIRSVLTAMSSYANDIG